MKKPKVKKIKKLLNFFKHKFVLGPILLVTIAGFLVAGSATLWVITLELPDLSGFENRRVAESTKIYDRTGEILLYDIHDDIRRTVVPFEQISDHIKHALVSIEDDNFYKHNGIDIMAIFRAIVKNLQDGDLLGGQGGSTITQQVLKNALLSSDKKLERKIKEWVLAPRLESLFTKDEILSIYLNEIPFGGNIYGVQEASLRFFGKEADTINIPEAAYLASLPKAPTYYSPYGNNVEILERRKNLVLKRMREFDYITENEYQQALTTVITFQKQEQFGIKAPHFVFYVRELLEKEFGESVVESGGLKVTTTLDWKLQAKAEEVTKKFALENKSKFDAENAAMVGLDPKTGQILVMVGSRDYFDEEIDGNFNIATSNRQPGSTFKPFVYAQAFKEGYLPSTVVYDVPTEFSTTCSRGGSCYNPGNYDDVFVGPINLRNALAQSRNIPAVKTLYLTGISDALALAKNMGVRSLNSAAQYGLTLVLGGGEVKPLEMTTAYGVFANEGIFHENTPILEIKDQNSEILSEYKENPRFVLERNITNMISDVLNDNTARSPLFGSSSHLFFPGRDVAAKTGTTNDYRDAWIIGYTPNFVLTAWAGNNNNRPIKKERGGLLVTPMWREVMNFALGERPVETFSPAIYPQEGTLKSVLEGDIQNGGNHSILHYVNKDNPRGPEPNNPASDPQYYLWERNIGGVTTIEQTQDQSFETPETSSVIFEIRNPENNTAYSSKTTIYSTFLIDAQKVSSFEVSLDGETIQSLPSSTNTLVLSPETNPLLKPGSHILTITGVTSSGETVVDSKTFTITE